MKLFLSAKKGTLEVRIKALSSVPNAQQARMGLR